MNRRSFFSSLFAAPIAAAVALKSKTFVSGGIVDAPITYVIGHNHLFKLDEDARSQIAKVINQGILRENYRLIRKECAIG